MCALIENGRTKGRFKPVTSASNNIVNGGAGSAYIGDIHVVDQALAGIGEDDFKVIDIHTVSVPEGVGIHKRDPSCLARFIAVAPIGGLPVVAACVNQLQTTAAAVGPLPPFAALVVGDIVNDHALGILQDNPAALMRQLRIIRSDCILPGHLAGQLGAVPPVKQAVNVMSDDEIAVGWNRSPRKSKGDVTGKLPAGQILTSAFVEKLNVLVFIAGVGIKHDFVYDNIADIEGRIRGSRRLGNQLLKASSPIAKSSDEETAILSPTHDRFENPRHEVV